MVRLLVTVGMLGIGRMGHRGLIGHRTLQAEKLRMLVKLVVLFKRLVLVRKMKLAVVVQHMGLKPRLWARRVEGRPAAAGADKIPYRRRRRIGRGSPRARRSPDASHCGGKRLRQYILFGAAPFAPFPAGAG